MRAAYLLLLALLGLAAAQPTGVRYKVGNFSASDSVSVMAFTGATSGGALGFPRVNSAGTGVEFVQPSGTGVPANVGSPVFTTSLTSTGPGGLPNAISPILHVFSTDSYSTGKSGCMDFGGRYNSAGDMGQWGFACGEKDDNSDGSYGGGISLWTRPNGSAPARAVTITSAQGAVFAGTVSVTGDFAVNTNKFVVTASSGNVVSAGSIKTGNPSGSTAASWKMGTLVEGTCTLNGGLYVTADADGTPVKIATVTCL